MASFIDPQSFYNTVVDAVASKTSAKEHSAENLALDLKTYQDSLSTINKYKRFSSATMIRQLSKFISSRDAQAGKSLQSFSDQMYASLLLADISGFTRLSSRLTAEQLKFHINEYFSMVMKVIKRHGGDVIRYFGDAILIIWPIDLKADSHLKKATAMMASLCALELVTDCANYERGEGNENVSLKLHCAIGTGFVHGMCLGEAGRWEYLLTGEPLQQLAVVLKEAGVGEVGLSVEAYELVKDRLECKPTNSTHSNSDPAISTAITAETTPSPPISTNSSARPISSATESAVCTSYILTGKVAGANHSTLPNHSHDSHTHSHTHSNNNSNKKNKGINISKRFSDNTLTSSTTGSSTMNIHHYHSSDFPNTTILQTNILQKSWRKSLFRNNKTGQQMKSPENTQDVNLDSIFTSNEDEEMSGGHESLLQNTSKIENTSTDNNPNNTSVNTDDSGVLSSGNKAVTVVRKGSAPQSQTEAFFTAMQQISETSPMASRIRSRRSSWNDVTIETAKAKRLSNNSITSDLTQTTTGSQVTSDTESASTTRSGNNSTHHNQRQRIIKGVSTSDVSKDKESTRAAVMATVKEDAVQPVEECPSPVYPRSRHLSINLPNSPLIHMTSGRDSQPVASLESSQTVGQAVSSGEQSGQEGGQRRGSLPLRISFSSQSKFLSHIHLPPLQQAATAAAVTTPQSKPSNMQPPSQSQPKRRQSLTEMIIANIVKMSGSEKDSMPAQEEKVNSNVEEFKISNLNSARSLFSSGRSFDGSSKSILQNNNSPISVSTSISLSGQSSPKKSSSKFLVERADKDTDKIVFDLLLNHPDFDRVRGYLYEHDIVDYECDPKDTISHETIENLKNLAEILRLFVHESVRTALEGAGARYMFELRNVTTIFIEILNLQNDFENGLTERPQKVIRTVLICLKRYGGTLRQYCVDDKGCVVIAAFGLPGSTHEDNGLRAIETTLAIRNMLKKSSIMTRAGVAEGQVYCGLVGSPHRCEYAIMGSSVNLAARLMGLGDELDVLIDERVYNACNSRFMFESRPKILVKGYDDPVAVFKPTERVSNSALLDNSMNNELPFTGRRKEVTALRDIINRCRINPEAKPENIVIEGAPSVGKTRLVLEALKDANVVSSRTVVGIGTLSHANSDYYVIRQILDQLMGLGLNRSLEGIVVLEDNEDAKSVATASSSLNSPNRNNGYHNNSHSMSTKSTGSDKDGSKLVKIQKQFSSDIHQVEAKAPLLHQRSEIITTRTGINAYNSGHVYHNLSFDIIEEGYGSPGKISIHSGNDECKTPEPTITARSLHGVTSLGLLNSPVDDGLLSSNSLDSLPKTSSKKIPKSRVLALDSSLHNQNPAVNNSLRRNKKLELNIKKINSISVDDSDQGNMSGDEISPTNRKKPQKVRRSSETSMAQLAIQTWIFSHGKNIQMTEDFLLAQVQAGKDFDDTNLNNSGHDRFFDSPNNSSTLPSSPKLSMAVPDKRVLERMNTIKKFSSDVSGQINIINLCPLLNSIFETKIADTSMTLALSQRRRKLLTDALVVRLLLYGSEKVYDTLFIENLQWCDTDSLRIILKYLTVVGRGVFIGSMRSLSGIPPFTSNIKTSAKLSEIQQQALVIAISEKCSRINLSTLDVLEVRHLMEEIIGQELLSKLPNVLNQDTVMEVADRSTGLPVHVAILAAKMKVALQSGSFPDLDRLPISARDIIIREFDQLNETDQIVIKTASVLGINFHESELAYVLMKLEFETVYQHISQSIRNLIRRHLIVVDDESGCYRFADRSIKDGIYHLMLSSQRSQVHGIIAAYLEELCGGEEHITLHDRFRDIVRHYYSSDLILKKIYYLEQCALMAIDEHSYHLAYRQYKLLILLASKTEIEGCLSLALGELLSQSSVNTSKTIPSTFRLSAPKHNSSRLNIRRIFNLSMFLKPDRIQSTGEEVIISSTLSLLQKQWLHGYMFTKRSMERLIARIDHQEITPNLLARWIGSTAICYFKLGNLLECNNSLLLALATVGIFIPRRVKKSKKRLLQHTLCRPGKAIPVFSEIDTLFQSLCHLEYLFWLQLLCGLPECAYMTLKISFRVFTTNQHLVFPPEFISNDPEATVIPAQGNYDSNLSGSLLRKYQHLQLFQQIMKIAFVKSVKSSETIDNLPTQLSIRSIHPSDDCLIDISRGYISLSKGDWDLALGYFTSAGELSLAQNEVEFHKFALLGKAWCSFLTGSVTYARTLCSQVLDFSTSMHHFALQLWALELDILLRAVAGDVEGVDCSILSLQSLQSQSQSRSQYEFRVATSAIIAFAYSLRPDDTFKARAFALAVRACQGLSSRPQGMPIAGVYLFFALIVVLENMEKTVGRSFLSRSTSQNALYVDIIKEAIEHLEDMSHRFHVLEPFKYAISVYNRLLYARGYKAVPPPLGILQFIPTEHYTRIRGCVLADAYTYYYLFKWTCYNSPDDKNTIQDYRVNSMTNFNILGFNSFMKLLTEKAGIRLALESNRTNKRSAVVPRTDSSVSNTPEPSVNADIPLRNPFANPFDERQEDELDMDGEDEEDDDDGEKTDNLDSNSVEDFAVFLQEEPNELTERESFFK